MWRVVWRGKVFFYWLTVGLRSRSDFFDRPSDLHQREESSVSMANISGNIGHLAEPLKFDPQGQSLARIENSSLVDGGRSLLMTTHATSINESTVRENAFPSFGIQGSSTTSPDDDLSSRVRRCNCFVCLKLFKTSKTKEGFPLARRDGEDIHCRIPGCDWNSKGKNSLIQDFQSRIDHEKRHFMEPRPNLSLACTQVHCNFITKREPDLRRHYRSMHCLNPNIFPCPVLWCKYSGVNGFTRKDKLTSHYRNVHEGKIGRGQALRRIQPALAASSAFEGWVSVAI